MIPIDKIYINDIFNLGKHEGLTAVICGSAPCLFQSYKKVQSNISNFVTIGINEAIHAIYCDKLVTAHPENIEYFVSKSINKDIETHTTKGYYKDWSNKADYFWTDIKKGATSGIDAVQVARKMGFKKIILCGMPMTGKDGYFHTKKAPENTKGCPRFGNKENHDLVARHQAKLRDIVKDEDFSNVSSLNGFTAKVFGETIFKD